MPEEEGVFGEDAPVDSPPQTTDAEGQEPQGEPTGEPEGQEPTAEGKEAVPYERFQEVNDKFRSAETDLNTATAKIAELEQQGQQPPEDPTFETPEDIIDHQEKSVDKKLTERDQVWESRLEAQDKMNELNQAFPEIKEDHHFADFLTTKLQNNPGMDVMKAAKEVKDYFGEHEKRGRESAEKDFIQKGSFQGGVVSNQPLEQSDEDKEYVDSIVNAGGNKADGVF